MGRTRATLPGEVARRGLPKVTQSAQAELPRPPKQRAGRGRRPLPASFPDADSFPPSLPPSSSTSRDPAPRELLLMQLPAPSG